MSYWDSIAWAVAGARDGTFEAIFALVFLVVGFAVVGSLVYQSRIRRWPRTPGTLLDAGVAKFGADASHRYEQDYQVDVRYRYEVSGVEYEGHRFSAWGVTASHNAKWILQRRLKSTTRGDGLDVFYNPKKPAKAFLVRPGWIGMAVTAAFGVFCFLCPMLVQQAVS